MAPATSPLEAFYTFSVTGKQVLRVDATFKLRDGLIVEHRQLRLLRWCEWRWVFPACCSAGHQSSETGAAHRPQQLDAYLAKHG
jgi:hypothetical protein